MSRRALRLPQSGDVGPTTPLRLDVAAGLAFPDGSITAASLRSEARRGRLALWRIAGKDMTTLAAIAEMLEQCRVSQNLPASGSGRPERTEPPSGSFSTEEANSALASALLRAQKLSKGSPSTSRQNASRRESATVIPIKS